MQQNHRRNLDEIQLARAFAIFAVIIVHSTSNGVTVLQPDSTLYPLYTFLNTAGKLGTPTFIMLSSFVLFYNYYLRETNGSLIKRFYVKRLKYILVPYILFSAIYFGVKWYIYYDYPSLAFAAEKFLTQLAKGDAHTHLYFVFISVQLYIMFPILMILFKKSTFLRKNLIWIGLALQWLWVVLNRNYFGISDTGSISFSYFSFYFIGAYLGIYYDSIREKMRNASYRGKIMNIIFTSFGAMLVLYTGYMYLARINQWGPVYEALPAFITKYFGTFTWATYALLAGLVVFYLAHLAEKKFGPRTKMFFMEIGATSFGIYILHPLILLAIRITLSPGNPYVYHALQIGVFISITVLSWLAVRLTHKFLPHYWIVFGKLPPQQMKRGEERVAA
ncbi:acyltransferase [Tenuibacillus multivorans]|uniref:Surface polysaccharide O-acyltransferase, integral membrane enzyme n=1 Tax=Tenuibacillus multivorans TaxID=237069 RepID=A0A1G9X6P3_9BACI|nr:acyltransferase [Tenuibacillus multivorans]GEL78646.1 acyltransferase 3 [Tenuibacillus multivorans]SDM92005.1 Surface polysaccharide O-acyltransferase, integral membrane enzyme [Tenuibacillus multivorans]